MAPQLSVRVHNETRRFIVFVDILYEQHVRLGLHAEVSCHARVTI